ncbi:MAG: periplasmic solute binding protein [Microbacteriaceae bacterium]|jgi:zinc/manganese transport system substrate-binding protein|nr:periplasmic solute binding protein [Microbacteriaceae bacterium]
MRTTSTIVALVSGAALVLAATGCTSTANASSSSGSSSGVINVVAGENFWGNIIGQIGGSHVAVTSIVSDPNADPHEYEASAANAAAIANANFVLENGLGYDDFMSKLLSSSPSSSRDVMSVQKILNITGANPNPHVWYDTARLPQVSAAIVKELSKLDPKDSATFAANGQTFDASLKPILNVISQIKSKYAGTEIAYTERVPGYLVDAAGLKLGVPVTFTQAIEDGSDPSPADTAAFDAAVTSKSVKVLLYNGQVTDQATDNLKTLATKSGVPIVGVSETLPTTDKNFQAWQLRQDTELLKALGN